MGKKRVLIGCLNLESNSLTPYLASERDFTVKHGEEMLKNSLEASYLAAQGFDVIPSFYAWSEPSGKLKLSTYTSFVDKLLSAIPTDGSIDGIWLNCHGAMQVEFINSGEAFLVSQIRERVGPAVPIALSLDFHASISNTLCRAANILVGFRTAPHVDIPETRMTAVKLLARAVKEGVLPRTKIIKIPMIMPGEYCTTEAYPTNHIIDRLKEIEKLPGVWRASYFSGMCWCDCAHNGASVVVSGVETGEETAAAMLSLAKDIWSLRHEFKMTTGTIMDPSAAVEACLKSPSAPVFISDSGDNTTAGATGDSAYMLRLCLEKHAEDILIAGIYDDQAVQKCAATGVGGSLSLEVGAGYDVGNVRVSAGTALVKHLQRSDSGAVLNALVSVSGVDVILTSSRTDFTSADSFSACGANWHDYKAIVVKLGYLFPGLTQIAASSIIAATPGNSILDITGVKYFNQRRPMFPLEDGFVYDPDESFIY